MDTGTVRMIAHVDDGIGTIVLRQPREAQCHDRRHARRASAGSARPSPRIRTCGSCRCGAPASAAFISGADINQLEAARSAPAPSGRHGRQRRPHRRMLALEQARLAMIHGCCIGGGVMVALAADLRVCADDAEFGIPAAKLGVGYPYEATPSSWRWSGRVRPPRSCSGDAASTPSRRCASVWSTTSCAKHELDAFVRDARSATSPTTRRCPMSRTSARSTPAAHGRPEW